MSSETQCGVCIVFALYNGHVKIHSKTISVVLCLKETLNLGVKNIVYFPASCIQGFIIFHLMLLYMSYIYSHVFFKHYLHI